MLRIGIVGHRILGNEETIQFVAGQSTSILERALRDCGQLVALSAIAEGSDTLFAEAALRLGIPFEIVRPFERYSSDFTTDEALRRYEELRSRARRETVLPFLDRCEEAYVAAMNWIIQNSDLVVAAWNGVASCEQGGTGRAVNQLRSTGRAWIHLNVVEHFVTYHLSDRFIGFSCKADPKMGSAIAEEVPNE
jgi:hypothetical protein